MERLQRPKVTVVMPAYNAARTLKRTLDELPAGTADEIILVDDASRDGTAQLARDLGLVVFQHDRNRGYGANQKTCYTQALARGADIMVLLHPDYQYDARLVPYMVNFIRDGYFDVMLGSRIRTRREALEGGMPRYKYVANRVLTAFGNMCLGQALADLHTGMRAIRRDVLERMPFLDNADGFVFDAQFIVQAVAAGARVAEIPVPVRYGPDASSVDFRNCIIYGFGFLGAVLSYPLWRIHLCRPRFLRFAPAPPAVRNSQAPEHPQARHP